VKKISELPCPRRLHLRLVKLALEVREELVDRYHGGASQSHDKGQQQEHEDEHDDNEEGNNHDFFLSLPSM
jgi:hypothetical protein